MILGVSLVVDELNKGPRLVFSYPDSCSSYHQRSIPGLNIQQDIKEYHKCAAFVARMYKQYFQLCQENFARLFVTKGSLTRKSLDLSIGDLNFVSFPCSTVLTEEELSKLASDERPHQVISMFNLVITTISGAAMQKVNKHFSYKCQNKYMSYCGEDPIGAALGLRIYNHAVCKSSLRRVLEAATIALCQLEKSEGYLSNEVLKILHVQDMVKEEEKESSAGQSSATLSVVVEFGRTRRSTSNASAMSHCSTVDQHSPFPQPADAETASQVNEQQGSSSSGSTHGLRLVQHDEVEQAEVKMAVLMQHSSLANELRCLFHSLTGGHSVALQFRGSKLINVGLTCKDKPCPDSAALVNSLAAPRLLHLPVDIGHTVIPQDLLLNRHHSVDSKYKGVCPGVQTMLLLAESEVILKMLSVLDGKNMAALNGPLKQSRLYNFIETADPTLSFFDMSIALDEPMDELTSMAGYLQSWGLAEVVPIVYAQSVFKVHRDAPLQANTRVATAFDRFIKGCMYLVSQGMDRPPPTSNKQRPGKRGHNVDHSPRYARSTPREPGSSYKSAVLSSPVRQLGFPYRHEQKVEGNDAPQVTNFVFPMGAASSDSFVQKKMTTSESMMMGHASGRMQGVSPERLVDIPAYNLSEWTLSRVLSLFDGVRTLTEVTRSLPTVLQAFAVDIVIFLLRWHMLVSVEVYIVNLMAMPLTYRELRIAANTANLAAAKDTHGVPEEKYGSILEEQMTFLHNPWVKKLSPPEQDILKKVAPYLQESVGVVHSQHQHPHAPGHSSSKTVSEILLQTRVRETDLLHVLGKLPFIQIVRKVVPPYVST